MDGDPCVIPNVKKLQMKNKCVPPPSLNRRAGVGGGQGRTWVGVDPVGEDCLRGGLAVGLRGGHASETVDADGRGDAGYCRGADARWGTTT